MFAEYAQALIYLLLPLRGVLMLLAALVACTAFATAFVARRSAPRARPALPAAGSKILQWRPRASPDMGDERRAA